jgi:hypothetical protein
MARKVLLPAAAASVAIFSLAAVLPAIAGNSSMMQPFGDNSTSTSSANATEPLNLNATSANETQGFNNTTTSTASLIMDNGTLDCKAIATKLGGIPVPNGNVCDVVVVRQSPQITGHSGMNMNQFTLMNSVLEFVTVPANATTMTSSNTTTSMMSNMTSNNSTSGFLGNNTSMPSSNMTGNTTTSATGTQQVYVMGDFALLETEMNNVLTVVKDNGWTVTGIHNHMINETPKTSFMHWETQGDINSIIDQANQAFAQTSIKG